MTVEILNTPGPGSWVCPDYVFTVKVTCFGGGENGASQADPGSANGLVGGGGGACSIKNVVSVTPGNSYSYRVGENGLPARESFFDSKSVVHAHGGGSAGAGIGGQAADGAGDVKFSGGNGGSPGVGTTGGGGGGGAGNAANGSNGSSGGSGGAGGSSGGGAGGAGGTIGNPGSAGSTIGGGGGGAGAGTSIAGGDGSVGEIWLEYEVQQPPLPTKQTQRHYELPDLNFQWWQQGAVLPRQPIPVSYLPWPPLLRLLSQQFYDTPEFDLNYLQVRSRKKFPPLLGFSVGYQGDYAFYGNVVLELCSGQYRVANDIAGYVLYVGEDAHPTFDGSPEAYSPTLPLSYVITPPGSGTTTFHVVVRRRDEYGLESQNQQAQLIVVDDNGDEVLPPVPVPQDVVVLARPNNILRILAKYPTFNLDLHPATHWRVWISASAINPVTDPPTASVEASNSLRMDRTGWPTGTYNVVVGLYRNVDGGLGYVATTITVPDNPDPVQGVFSGHDLLDPH